MMKYTTEEIRYIESLLPYNPNIEVVKKFLEKFGGRTFIAVNQKVKKIRRNSKIKQIDGKGGYDKHVLEFARVRMEQTPSDVQIARDVINKFGLDKTIDAVRKWVGTRRHQENIKAKEMPIKRLFVDIETSYLIYRRWKFGAEKYVNPEMIIEDSKIICICYKWQYEDTVHSLDWRIGERKMLKEFAKVLDQANEIVAHNGDRFDVKEFRTRCIYHGVLVFPRYRTLDTLKKARQYFNFSSNKLDYIARFLKAGKKLDTGGIQLWIDVVENKSQKALKKMIDYCKMDVLLLEDVFFVMNPFITHNNNFAVLKGGQKWDCPECTSKNVHMYDKYATPLGIIRRKMKCNNCKKQYPISNKTYMAYLDWLRNRK